MENFVAADPVTKLTLISITSRSEKPGPREKAPGKTLSVSPCGPEPAFPLLIYTVCVSENRAAQGNPRVPGPGPTGCLRKGLGICRP